jgi:pimeloyl-ACP methyl ester carboxylesterase
VRQLHSKALATGERDLLFALAEISYLTGEQVRRSVKPWDARDARDYYLGAAVYAYLFLFNQSNSPSVAFDRRFRAACDLYNYSLGLALARPKDTNGLVNLQNGKRRLPVGEVEIQLNLSEFPWPLENFQEFLLGDQFLVRGLSVRNRQAGIGAPLIAVPSRPLGLTTIRTMTAATALLRLKGGLKELSAGACKGELELYSAFGDATVQIGQETVPLETDFSVHMAYGLNQTLAWQIHRIQFLSLHEVVPTGVYFSQPYEAGRIPVVLVHGTMSSPVWWAEMLNALRADPVLRKRCQFWFFIYNSSAPVLFSAEKLRHSLEARLKEVDPEGNDPALRQMVVIGHSQGGLLTKMISTDTGDQLWRSVSNKSLDEMNLTSSQKEEMRDLLFLNPMPCVRRTVFIATPHRGSYRVARFVQDLTRRLISIPSKLPSKAETAAKLVTQLKLPSELAVQKRTSIDGMSPNNPVLRALAEIPVGPGIKAHSIIPVAGSGDFHNGNDGVVEYKSAHVDYAESELVIRHKHSCQDTPAAIEEVRRILHLHLN